jgi:flagellin-like protein
VKGISPLIAGVLLILFTVAVAGLLVPFASDIVSTVGQGSEDQA